PAAVRRGLDDGCHAVDPASYFHLLRRHHLDGIRRPLVVFTPNRCCATRLRSAPRGLHHRKFRSVFEEPSYESEGADRSKVKRVLLTSGKIYWELLAKKQKENRDDVAIVRIEQLYPIPRAAASRRRWTATRTSASSSGPGEPANQGAWPFLGLALPELLPERLAGIKRVSRRAMSAPSSGSSKVHAVEQQEIIETAFSPTK
ncbi:multifunctional oxoglutarate decarboxylase/oxoglutarate dehydrogenase thiamine pyrophosphate-binding subunit/dihydrolipoyllysine-residue succinyltransferase subunit, partial [Rhodococcus hoagii]|nr:multifunctional oxoglutarate decarboxylase/oxoglutarate dehydrogenase thiamine pyrophosphate-binding subunit/dihydrolipoyllysine-residue succinyltransferase subunit [Prescottella equi]